MNKGDPNGTRHTMTKRESERDRERASAYIHTFKCKNNNKTETNPLQLQSPAVLWNVQGKNLHKKATTMRTTSAAIAK